MYSASELLSATVFFSFYCSKILLFHLLKKCSQKLIFNYLSHLPNQSLCNLKVLRMLLFSCMWFYSILVGTCDSQTQSARACLFFSLHLDGLKTPIYTQTIVKWVARIDGGIQKKVKEPQPKPPLYPSPQTHPPKNLKI
jgi:hypothetical protein